MPYLYEYGTPGTQGRGPIYSDTESTYDQWDREQMLREMRRREYQRLLRQRGVPQMSPEPLQAPLAGVYAEELRQG